MDGTISKSKTRGRAPLQARFIMTDYDYFQLSPRERDAQIAEYVMNYCVRPPLRDNHPGRETHYRIQRSPYRQLNERHPEDEYYCPEYTSNWMGVGDIQGRMKELGFDKFSLNMEEEKWSAYFGKSEKKKKGLLKGVNEDGRAMADNPFDAVALAALKARHIRLDLLPEIDRRAELLGTTKEIYIRDFLELAKSCDE